MFMLKLGIVCTVMFFLVGCSRTVYPVSGGSHTQIPEKNTHMVVWGDHEAAVGAAVIWLQTAQMRLVERARMLKVLGLHQIEWVGSTDEPLLDRDPVPQNGSRWLGCIALYCESRDSGF